MKMRTSLVLSLALLGGCAEESPPPLVLPEPRPAQSGFVDFFLRDLYSHFIDDGVPLIINSSNSISPYPFHNSYEELLASIEEQSIVMDPVVREAVLDFYVKNQSSSAFNPSGGLSFKHILCERSSRTLVPYSETGEIIGSDEVETDFLPPELKRVIVLTQPGFSANGNTAVILRSSSWGYDVGTNSVFVYEKRGGEWEQVCVRFREEW